MADESDEPVSAPSRRRPKPRSGGLLTSTRWKKLRLRVIAEEPICRLQLSVCRGRSDTADHIIPVSHRPDLRYLRSNLRGACQPCNNLRRNRPLSEVRAEDAARVAAATRKQPSALEFFS